MLKRHISRSFSLLLLLLAALTVACGKKGPPSLASYEKPEPPANLHALHREDSILLQWSYPKSKEVTIKEFILLKSSGADFSPVALVETKTRAYEERDFTIGTTYRYKLLARSQRQVLSNDSNVVAVTPEQPPRPPVRIISRTQDMDLILTWEGVGSDVTYNIYKGHEQGHYGPSPVNSAPLKETSFRDSLDLQRAVYYSIRSLTRKPVPDEGPLSQEYVVSPETLVPPAPKNVLAVAASDAVSLSWEASPEPWVVAYRIYRRTEGHEFIRLGETQIPAFRDGEGPLTLRDYRVTAVGPAREGQWTEVRGVMFVPQQ